MATLPIDLLPRAALSTLRALAARLRYGRPRSLNVIAMESYQDYIRYRERYQNRILARNTLELSLLDGRDHFSIGGFCYPCGKVTDFVVDYRYGTESAGVRIPNWRESLSCECGLNNRLRASIQLFDRCCAPRKTDRIYITEQTTPMYRWLVGRYTQVTGSEYLGDRIPSGAVSNDGVRNESLTHLTFPAAYFDQIISFDVLEHIPDIAKALRECYRCLKPGGNLLLSVPFVASAEHTLVRAIVGEDGVVEHLHTPEYHGDPLSSDGCLCFYHFGWDLLDQLRAVGFTRAQVLVYWSRELGYLGGDQLQLLAAK